MSMERHDEGGVIAKGSSNLPSNWGRWGEGDELDTLSLITAEAWARAAAELRSGRAASLGLGGIAGAADPAATPRRSPSSNRS